MESFGLQAKALSDGTTAYVQQDANGEKLIEGQVIELEDGSRAFVQQVTLQKESITFEDGQPVALEDGTMAFIHHAPQEGYDPNTLEAIQLEDGSTAFIHRPVSLSVDSTTLTVQADVGLEELAVGEKDDSFELDSIAALKDYASKGFHEEEVESNGKEPKVPDRVYRCGYSGCSRLFTTSHHLKVHKRVHTGDRPYRCDFSSCGKTFATGYSLKSHVRTHTGEKPYKCPEDLCTKAFKTSGDLQKHIRTHTGERPFRCPFEGCGRSFTTSNIRKVHIRTHTGERPYMCPEHNCGRGFSSATNFKNHMRIHTGEKPYACLVPGCGKRFTEYSSLYKHHVVHTHCKPYTCNTCGKTYRQTSTLAMHKRTTHGELEATEESEQALYEQQMRIATFDMPSLKHQCIVSVKVEHEEEQEDCRAMPVTLVSQDGAEQVSLSPEDLQVLGCDITMLTQNGTAVSVPQEDISASGTNVLTMIGIDGTEIPPVLSHNLYTVLCIPHDPVALEEHFKDDDDGPVSSQGYMPYLNKYILDKVEEGAFVKESFDELCWTLTAKKNYKPNRNGNSVVSHEDAFKLWCLFNFLSEDKYPLVMVPDEVEYLLKKICTAMSIELNSGELEDFFSQEAQQQSGLTVWQFLDLVNSGRFLRGIEREAISMAVEEVYQEIIGDVLKQGYLWKKGHLRRNWSERWFTLKPSDLSYYVSEERKEKKGSISLDRNSCVEILPDKDGKRCMFCVKTPSRTYEMSASDTRQRQEWTLAIQMAIRLQAEGKKSLHKDLKQKRREQREQRERKKAAKEEEMQRLKQLQEEKERKLQELELLKEAQRQAELLLHEEEERRQQQHEEMQRTLEIQLQEAEKARANMQAEMVLKEAEAERQRKRITELEEMQQRLQDALHQEVKARQDEEAVRYAQARLLNEEEEKLKQLMKLKEEQEEYIIRTQHEKLILKQEMENKSKFLEEAQQQLEEVRVNRERVDQDVMLAQRKLQQASTNVKHWNVQMNRLMHPIAPGEKRTVVSGGFPGFNPALLSRRDSSLKLKQNLEKKKSDAMKNGSKENLNGEMEKQLQAPDKDHPSSETL